MSDLPDIPATLPHRPPLLLLGQCLASSREQAAARAVVGPQWPLAGAQGVDAVLAIELVAQTAGLAACWREGEGQALGLLVGIKQARFLVQRWALGAELLVEARLAEEVGDYRVFQGQVSEGGRVLAVVTLQVMKVPREQVFQELGHA